MAARRLLHLALGCTLVGCEADPTNTDGAVDPGPDTDSSDTADTADTAEEPTELPDGDNLAAVGISAVEFLEPTATAWLGDDTVLLCTGTNGIGLYDVSDLTLPVRTGGVTLPRPASFRCQHLAQSASGAMVVTHHADEMADGWIGLIDVADPAAVVGLDAWAGTGVEPEGVAFLGEDALVAAHEDGILRFSLTGGTIAEPTSFAADIGNAYAIAVSSTGRIAVGTVDGDVKLLDENGAVLSTVTVSGAVRDVEWLPDGALVVGCGSSGLDRVDFDAAAVTAHAQVYGSAVDMVVLDDGSVAVADWNDVRVFDGPSLALLSVESPVTGAKAVALLGIEQHENTLFVAEWEGLRTYAWDPEVSAPDIHPDVTRVDLGTLGAGETGVWSLVLRNEGPKPLVISEISSDNSAVSLSATTLTIPPGGADYIEVSWLSDGGRPVATVLLSSNDPDEGALKVEIDANRPGTGVGDMVPEFNYAAVNGTGSYDSRNLGGPALLSYFATY